MKKIISRAPGRTCLFGEHQDYLGLPVIACAIDRNITLSAVKNHTDNFCLKMNDINQERVINIHATFNDLSPRDYFASSLRVLKRHGCIPKEGYDIHINGNIPINSGTSSSTALLMAWINFLIKAFGINDEISSELIAKLGYSSEVLEHGEPGGMMDHYSICIGNIVYINTAEPFSYAVIGTELKGLITGVSGVPKDTIDLISEVKKNTLKAIEIIKEKFENFDLIHSKTEDLEYYLEHLPSKYIPYFKATIQNHHYTKEALIEFKKTPLNLQKIGALMNEHHAVLRDLLKISIPKIDQMIDAALKAGAYGAKIVGSGGGGSIVVLAEPGYENKVIKAILEAGAIDAYSVKVDTGVQIVSSN